MSVEDESVGATRHGHVFRRNDCDPARDPLYPPSSREKKKLPLDFIFFESKLGKVPL